MPARVSNLLQRAGSVCDDDDDDDGVDKSDFGLGRIKQIFLRLFSLLITVLGQGVSTMTDTFMWNFRRLGMMMAYNIGSRLG